MTRLPEVPFANPVWHALHGPHRRFALREGGACRYPSDVAPFAALAAPGAAELRELHSLMTPGESVWLADAAYPQPAGMSVQERLACLQMVHSGDAALDAPREAVPLGCAHAQEMLALTQLAFPGFFRPRTCEMGAYYGVRAGCDLVAMAGERLQLEGYPEVSGVCTHPEHRGKGHAAMLLARLVHDHRRAGRISWLQVGAENHRAIELYRRLGFQTARTITLVRMRRNA